MAEQDLVLSVPLLSQYGRPGGGRIACVLGGTCEAWTDVAGVRGLSSGQAGAKEMA